MVIFYALFEMIAASGKYRYIYFSIRTIIFCHILPPEWESRKKCVKALNSFQPAAN